MTLAAKLRNKHTEMQDAEREKTRLAQIAHKKWLNEKLKEAPETAKGIVEKWMKEIEEHPYILKSGQHDTYFTTDSGDEDLHKAINVQVEKYMKKNDLKIIESKQTYTPYEEGRGEDNWGTHEHYSQHVKFKW